MIGIACNLLFVLYNTARPNLNCEVVEVDNGQKVILVTPDQSLFFSAAEYVKHKVLKAASDHPEADLIVLDGHYVHHMDATMATNLRSLADDCKLLNKLVVFWNWPPQPRGVAIRLTAEFKPLFKRAPTLDSLVQMVNSSNQNAVSIMTTTTNG